MYKIKTLFISIFIFTAVSINAQHGYYDDPDEHYGNNKSKSKSGSWFLGPSFGFAASNYSLNADFELLVGYRFIPRFCVGIGPIVNYVRYNEYENDVTYIGGRGLVQFNVIQDMSELFTMSAMNIFLRGEYEQIAAKPMLVDNGVVRKSENWETVNNTLIGVGLGQPIGTFGMTNIVLLYDINQHPMSSRTNPIFKFEFWINLGGKK